MSRIHIYQLLTYISFSNFTSTFVFLSRLDSRKKRFYYESLVLRSLPPHRIFCPNVLQVHRTSTQLRMILHDFTKYSIIHLNYKFFSNSLLARVLKFILILFAKPWRLCELQYTVNFCDFETVTSTLLQITIMNYVTFLIIQRSEKLLISFVGWFLARRTEWQVCVSVVKMLL